MTVETATFISELDDTLPRDTDVSDELDEHLRLVKQVLQNTFVGDGAGDDYDQAVTATLTEMNSWDARIDALEVADTTVPSPVIGRVSLILGDFDLVQVTGIGFEPQQIIGVMLPNARRQVSSEISFASWDADTNTAFPHHIWSFDFGRGSKRHTSFLGILSFQSNSTSESLQVNATNSDGFDLFVGQNVDGMELMYVAFP